MVDLASKIKKLRTARGYTQRDFARELGISAGYLSQIEMGLRAPSRALLQRMADTFGASLDYLLLNGKVEEVEGVPPEIVEFFRSEHVTAGDRAELVSFFRWWRRERAHVKNRKPKPKGK